MFVTLMPVIFAGIFNMIWCKMPLLDYLKKPLDHNKKFSDDKRIFGDNKTYKGFIGITLFGIIFTVLWGFICKNSTFLLENNLLYRFHDNTLLFNIYVGFLLGIAYAIFELPNSFLKRRLSIPEGKTKNGHYKWVFVFYDQADSVIGCVLVVCIFYPMSFASFLACVLIGAATHIIINMLLYQAHLRKNMF